MKDTVDNAGGAAAPSASQDGISRRIQRSMAVAVTLAVIVSAPFAQLRITAGLLLGGLLSLLNHHWLSSSTAAAFSVVAHGEKPKLKLVQYILRYLVVGAVVFLAYKLNLVSIGATIAGLCSFVVALFVEALREFYFAIVHREETS
jgi:uncharacterized membrane protein YGL010W